MRLQTFVERKPCWRLTWQARLVLLSMIVAFIATIGPRLGEFLAVDAPVAGRFLVVEGWLPVYAFRDVADRFRNGAYEKIVVVGRDGADDSAECARERQPVRFGIPSDRLAIAFAAPTERDRTFHSALAVKAWLSEQGVDSTSLDVVTLGPHARRSRLIFEKALGDENRIGVISVVDRRFDQRAWWRSSAGFRIVTGEAIAYLYARFVPYARD